MELAPNSVVLSPTMAPGQMSGSIATQRDPYSTRETAWPSNPMNNAPEIASSAMTCRNAVACRSNCASSWRLRGRNG